MVNKDYYYIVRIEVRHDADTSIGIGWLLNLVSEDSSVSTKRLVVTNDHVLSKVSSFRIFTKDDVVPTHYESELLLNKSGVDIAFVAIDENDSIPDFL